MLHVLYLPILKDLVICVNYMYHVSTSFRLLKTLMQPAGVSPEKEVHVLKCKISVSSKMVNINFIAINVIKCEDSRLELCIVVVCL